MFIRFVVGREGEDHRTQTGVVAETRILRDQGVLHAYEVDVLETSYTWLNDNLPVPPYDSIRRRHPDASAWFRDSAPAIERMWDLVAILREHGVAVRLLRSPNPGSVLYEDDQQIVVAEAPRLR